jgi:hypothetical protein
MSREHYGSSQNIEGVADKTVWTQQKRTWRRFGTCTAIVIFLAFFNLVILTS